MCATPTSRRAAVGGVDVGDEVGGVHPGEERCKEQEQGTEARGGPDASTQTPDASVGDEEPQLLQRHPHEGEVQEAEALEPGRGAQHVDGDGCRDESTDRAVGGALVGGGRCGKQRLAQEGRRRGTRAADRSEARGRDQIGGYTEDREQREPDADDGDREDGGSQQTMQSPGHEPEGAPAALPQPTVGEEPGEPAR